MASAFFADADRCFTWPYPSTIHAQKILVAQQQQIRQPSFLIARHCCLCINSGHVVQWRLLLLHNSDVTVAFLVLRRFFCVQKQFSYF
jgi:hypothetical protein